LLCDQLGTCYVAGTSGNVLLSSIVASIALIIIAQYTLNIMLVVRQSAVVTHLKISPPPPPPGSTITTTASVNDARSSDLYLHHRANWTFAQLLHMLRRQVLEYFNPGRNPSSIEHPKPLCPLPGRPTHVYPAARRILHISRKKRSV